MMMSINDDLIDYPLWCLYYCLLWYLVLGMIRYSHSFSFLFVQRMNVSDLSVCFSVDFQFWLNVLTWGVIHLEFIIIIIIVVCFVVTSIEYSLPHVVCAMYFVVLSYFISEFFVVVHLVAIWSRNKKK